LTLSAGQARAGNVSWAKDADGSWAVASNWSSNPALPTANDDVTINVAGDRFVYVEGTQLARNLTVSERFGLADHSILNLGGVAHFDNVANLGNGTIRGGTLELGPNGALSLGHVALDGVTVNVPLNITSQQTSLSSNGLVLNSTLAIGAADGSTYCNVSFGGAGNNRPSGSLLGTGSVVFGAYPFAESNRLTNVCDLSGTAGTLTIGPGIIIRGGVGQIYNYFDSGTIVSQGTVLSDHTGGGIELGNRTGIGTFRNEGSIIASNGGAVQLYGRWSSALGGQITVNGGILVLGGSFAQAGMGTLTRTGGTILVQGTVTGDLALNANTGSWQIDGGTLSGGTYSATAGSALLVQQKGIKLDNATIASGTNLDLTATTAVGYESATISNNLTLNGTMTVGTSTVTASIVTKTSVASITGTGSISLINANIHNPDGTFTIGSGMTLHGKGATISNDSSTGSIVNAGMISADTGTITIGGTSGTFVNQGTWDANGGFALLNVSTGKVTNQGTLSARAGTLQIASAVQLDMQPTSKLVVAGTGSMKLGGHSGNAASIDISGGTLAMESTATGSSVLKTSALTISGTGRLDLANNRLVVDYDPAAAAGSPIASVRTALLAGYAAGKWNGPGIGSMGIAATRSLGYAEASDVLGASGGTFGSASVDGSAVLVRNTLAGDANLDGKVDFLDLARLAQNYNVTDGARTWSAGDFNYDGSVDFSDLAQLAQNYNVALPAEAIPGAPADFASDLATAFAAVPEPAALLPLATLVAIALCGQRHRRHGHQTQIHES
jgi:hypothetical protein